MKPNVREVFSRTSEGEEEGRNESGGGKRRNGGRDLESHLSAVAVGWERVVTSQRDPQCGLLSG